jgi:serine/threonine protein kinase
MGSLRWLAPERLRFDEVEDDPSPISTFAGDIYAFAMVILVSSFLNTPHPIHYYEPNFQETMTGNVPFAQYRNDTQVILALSRNERPSRSPKMKSDWLWNLVTRCWATEPEMRPPVRDVVKRIRDAMEKMREAIEARHLAMERMREEQRRLNEMVNEWSLS